MKKSLIFLLALVFLLAISIVYLSGDVKPEEMKVKNISIIIRGKTNEKWENLKQGAEQAGTDMNANISFISLSGENNISEQVRILNRELDGGVDAILISPVDYELMKPHIYKIKKKIPICLIESGLNDIGGYGYISCNNMKMGKDLAVEVNRHGNTRKNVMILDGKINCSSVQERKKAFIEEMKFSKNKLSEWNKVEYSWEVILEGLKTGEIDILVALDDSALENAAKALSEYRENEGKKIEVYGVGNSRDIINYLEKDFIVSTAVQDDFSIGYLGVQNVINAMDGKQMVNNNEITYAMIDKEHMYSMQNQRLLFPFIR